LLIAPLALLVDDLRPSTNTTTVLLEKLMEATFGSSSSEIF
jgi:hypothetical protein